LAATVEATTKINLAWSAPADERQRLGRRPRGQRHREQPGVVLSEMSNQNQQGLYILRRKQVEARTGLARSTIYQHIKAGTFPRPIPLGARAVGWLETDVSKWIAERIEMARDNTKPST
jgi:prophage regulatory protein